MICLEAERKNEASARYTLSCYHGAWSVCVPIDDAAYAAAQQHACARIEVVHRAEVGLPLGRACWGPEAFVPEGEP